MAGSWPSVALEARPETGCGRQGYILPFTGLDASHCQVTVRQLGNAFVPITWNANVAGQADIKVGIEGPLPEAAYFVIERLADTRPPLRSEFRRKSDIEQLAL